MNTKLILASLFTFTITLFSGGDLPYKQQVQLDTIRAKDSALLKQLELQIDAHEYKVK